MMSVEHDIHKHSGPSRTMPAAGWNNVGVACIRNGNEKQAVDCFQQALTTAVQEIRSASAGIAATDATATVGAATDVVAGADDSANVPMTVDDSILRWQQENESRYHPLCHTGLPVCTTPFEIAEPIDRPGRTYRDTALEASQRKTVDTAIIVFNIASCIHGQGLLHCKTSMLHKAYRMYGKAMELMQFHFDARMHQHWQTQQPLPGTFSFVDRRYQALLDLLVLTILNNTVQLDLYFAQYDRLEQDLRVLQTFALSVPSHDAGARLQDSDKTTKVAGVLESQRTQALVSIMLVRFPNLAAAA